MDRNLLENHYKRILTDNKERFLEGGVGDAFLSNAKNDNRMALVVLIRITSEIAGKINKCISELHDIEPDLYYYPCEDFHITVMDILRGEEGRELPHNLDDYIKCIRECCSEIDPFKITFDGLVASDNAIMVKGYYDEQLLRFRESLRNSLAVNGLSLEERYKTISSHITISRLYDKYKNPTKLMDYIEKPHSFGTMTVKNMEISFHNWYDTRKQLLSEVEL
ncbi:MAG: 2'-5' RNA ligase family protein [Butyrivibrio sp.]|nr:2'-5' RNA ligase family protein [Butyrivibrio sp.]